MLRLSEAVNAEVAGTGVTGHRGRPGPAPTEFQATNDADYLVNRLPAFAQFPAEQLVADALKAADRGRASVVPGRPHARLTLGSSRFVPTPLAFPVLTRMLQR